MKKIMVFAASVFAAAALSAGEFTLKNKFGSDPAIEFEKAEGTDENGEEKTVYTNGIINIYERLNLDFKSEKLDGRIRFEFDGAEKTNGKKVDTRLRTYIDWKPADFLGVWIGNNFFKKVSVDAAYMNVEGDPFDEGFILTNGFGLQILPVDGLEIGAGIRGEGNWFGSESEGLISDGELIFDAGLDYVLADVFSAGATFQNITSDERTMGFYAGLKAVENLSLNAGFVINPTAVVEGSANAIQATVAYDFADNLPLSLALDFRMGLASDEEGKNKQPLLLPFNVSYGINDEVSLVLGGSFAIDDLKASEVESAFNLEPKVCLALPSMGDFELGIGFDFDKDGLAKFYVPLTWECTIGKWSN